MHKKTQFEIRIYRIVKSIPKGKTLSYKTIAKMAGRPRSWRSVGNILSKNKNTFNCKAITGRSGATTGLKIPCHRVIRSDGKIGGYNKGEQNKIILLQKEGIIIKNGKIAFRLTR